MNEIIFPLAKDTVQKDDIDALCEWLSNYPRLTMGDLTKQFEQEAASWVGRKYGVFVNSGSSANLMMAYALKASNKLKNNKVVVPNVGWVTSIAPFMQFGFDVIMCPTSGTDFGLDLEKLNEICRKEDPAIVLFVQPLGVLINKEKLFALKMKHGFYLLEDACAAVGSEYIDGNKAGSVGDMSSWSLFFGHQICSLAEGGMVYTDDKELYNILVSIRSHGWLRDNDKDVYNGMFSNYKVNDFNKPFFFVYPGFNLRNTDVAAFVGLKQIKKLSSFAKIRDKNHRQYLKNLKGSGSVSVCQSIKNNNIISSISFAMLAQTEEHREEIVQRLNDTGIENRMYSAGSLSRHPFWKDTFCDGLNEYKRVNIQDYYGDQIHKRGFFVPNNQEMTIEDVDEVCKIILAR